MAGHGSSPGEEGAPLGSFMRGARPMVVLSPVRVRAAALCCAQEEAREQREKREEKEKKKKEIFYKPRIFRGEK
jgi:hypothetical protein